MDYIRDLHDFSVLAQLPKLTSLTVGGNWASFKKAHLTSLAFLRQMPQLEKLVVHTAVVDDGDYTPLLALPALKSVRVMAAPGMTPEINELKRRLPWSS